MTDSASTPTAKEIVIQGETFVVSWPYTEGHTLTAVEARALNQTRCENIGNNMRAAIKKAKEKGNYEHKAMVKMVADYDVEYTFAAGGGTARRTISPVEKEARAIARNLITQQLRKAGKKVKDQDATKIAELVDQWSEHPKVIASAKKVVKEREELANLSLDAA